MKIIDNGGYENEDYTGATPNRFHICVAWGTSFFNC